MKIERRALTHSVCCATAAFSRCSAELTNSHTSVQLSGLSNKSKPLSHFRFQIRRHTANPVKVVTHTLTSLSRVARGQSKQSECGDQMIHNFKKRTIDQFTVYFSVQKTGNYLLWCLWMLLFKRSPSEER